MIQSHQELWRRGAYRVSVGKPHAKIPLGKPRYRGEGNRKLYLKEICWERVGPSGYWLLASSPASKVCTTAVFMSGVINGLVTKPEHVATFFLHPHKTSCLTKVTSAGLLWKRQWTVWFYKMRGIWLTEETLLFLGGGAPSWRMFFTRWSHESDKCWVVVKAAMNRLILQNAGNLTNWRNVNFFFLGGALPEECFSLDDKHVTWVFLPCASCSTCICVC